MVEAGFVSGGEVLAGCFFLILTICICMYVYGTCMEEVALSSYIQYVKQTSKK